VGRGLGWSVEPVGEGRRLREEEGSESDEGSTNWDMGRTFEGKGKGIKIEFKRTCF